MFVFNIEYPDAVEIYEELTAAYLLGHFTLRITETVKPILTFL